MVALEEIDRVGRHGTQVDEAYLRARLDHQRLRRGRDARDQEAVGIARYLQYERGILTDELDGVHDLDQHINLDGVQRALLVVELERHRMNGIRVGVLEVAPIGAVLDDTRRLCVQVHREHHQRLADRGGALALHRAIETLLGCDAQVERHGRDAQRRRRALERDGRIELDTSLALLRKVERDRHEHQRVGLREARVRNVDRVRRGIGRHAAQLEIRKELGSIECQRAQLECITPIRRRRSDREP